MNFERISWSGLKQCLEWSFVQKNEIDFGRWSSWIILDYKRSPNEDIVLRHLDPKQDFCLLLLHSPATRRL